MAVPSLPPELVRDIVDAVISSNGSHAQRVPILASLALVSRTFYAIANPLLYRNLFLDTRRRSSILSALTTNSALKSHVTSLTVSGGNLSGTDLDAVVEVLRGCRNVTRLGYFCFDPTLLPAFTRFVAQTWSTTLRYLRADQKDGLYHLVVSLPNLEELVAARIDFPTPTTTTAPTVRASDASSTGRSQPLVPSFRLERFDSASSPLARDLDLLLSSSRSSLKSLDLPISSQSPLPNLCPFEALESMTLSLTERYIPHDDVADSLNSPSDESTPTRTRLTGRDDRACLVRVKRVLGGTPRARGAGTDPSRPGLPIKHLEIYEPEYSRTRRFSRLDIERVNLVEAVPDSVVSLDLSTLDIGIEYLARRLRLPEERRGGPVVCKGLKRITLKAATESSRDFDEVVRSRGIVVEWV
ncbi:hypothetical protein JCM10212_006800 [Sporobolomyces blumeae]